MGSYYQVAINNLPVYLKCNNFDEKHALRKELLIFMCLE